MSRKQKKRLGTVLTVIAVVLIILVLDIGLITNVLTAFKSPFTISSSPPKWIFKPTLDNFRNVLGKGSFDFRLYLWNSFVIAVISSSIAIWGSDSWVHHAAASGACTGVRNSCFPDFQ